MDPIIPSQETESTPMSATNQSTHQTCEKILTLYFLTLISALVGLAGNTVVLWLLGFSIRRNAISVYVLHLAVADFLFLCCRCIDSLIQVVNFYEFNIYTYGILSNGAIIPYISGLSILSAISIERCLSILWPIWYHCHRPRNMSAIICAVIWALALAMSILDWHYSGFLAWAYYDSESWKKVDLIITAFLIFLFMVLSGSSLILLVRILCSSRQIPLTRLYVTISLTVVVFLICGLPLGIYWFLLYWLQIHQYYPFCHLYQVTVFLSCINSCANPIIYFFVGSFRQQKRQTLKMVLQRALQDTPEEYRWRDSQPQETIEMSQSKIG
uniref:mas-related G-protein coupled receptor member X1-like n=1 Tax=Jaculus jaculus TaxID=51337 RepID=UPI001E1B0CEA|nr:mas-related G-protein coupled receptor member X1-like [Jaculus jaculus]